MTTVDVPSWVTVFLEGTGVSPADDDTHVTGISVSESVSVVRSFVHSPSCVAAARNLRGKEAQCLIDAIDGVSPV